LLEALVVPDAVLSLREVFALRKISPATALEASIVVRRLSGSFDELADWLTLHHVRVGSFDTAQLVIAQGVFERFGKGRHPASLNFGDCFSYALAHARDEPLLYKGEDFSKTDLESAMTVDPV